MLFFHRSYDRITLFCDRSYDRITFPYQKNTSYTVTIAVQYNLFLSHMKKIQSPILYSLHQQNLRKKIIKIYSFMNNLLTIIANTFQNTSFR